MAQRVLARSFPPLLKCCVGESVSPGVFQSDFPIPTFPVRTWKVMVRIVAT